jgi:DnaJ-class molecular chaperone
MNNETLNFKEKDCVECKGTGIRAIIENEKQFISNCPFCNGRGKIVEFNNRMDER